MYSDFIEKLFDSKLLDSLYEQNPKAYEDGKYLVELNEKLGFSLDYLKPCFLVYFDSKVINKLKLPADLKEVVETIKSIKELELQEKTLKKDWARIITSKIHDFRVVLALFADKVNIITHNDDKKDYLKLIEEIYLPLSHIIGINFYVAQFEDFVIRTKHKKQYQDLISKAKKHMLRDKNEINYLINEMENFRKYPDEELYGRIKNPYSVYKKVYVRNEKLQNITDYVAIRIITRTEEDCFSWMGYIFSKYPPIIGKIKDYISKPKPNGYKSLHATVLTKYGPVEFQVRTRKMHEFAEYGVAAHFRYKKMGSFSLSDKVHHNLRNRDHEKNEFKLGLEKIFVYTPKNDVIILDKGATVIDFAYAIHSEIGNKLVRALINDEGVNLDHLLNDGDTVNLFTDKNRKPSRKWLEFVVTKKAIDKIKSSLGITTGGLRKKIEKPKDISGLIDKTNIAKCCNPFCDDDLAIYKTSKRKNIIHTVDCLLKNNKEYSEMDEALRKLLLDKEVIVFVEDDIEEVYDKIKRTIHVEKMYKSINNDAISLEVKLKSRKELEDLKAKLLEIENVSKIELV